MLRRAGFALLLSLIAGGGAAAQAPPARPTPPTRDPRAPGFVPARELPDGDNAPASKGGNYILGPTHNPAPEAFAHPGVPQGAV